jgi:hypothetical protein
VTLTSALLFSAVIADIARKAPMLWRSLVAAATNWTSINRPRTYKIKDADLAQVRAFMSFNVLCYSYNQQFNFMQFFVSEAINLHGANTSTLFHALGLTMNRNITTDWVKDMAAFDVQFFLSEALKMDERLTFIVADNIDVKFVLLACHGPVSLSK